MQSTNRYITDRDIAYLYLFELAATGHTFLPPAHSCGTIDRLGTSHRKFDHRQWVGDDKRDNGF